LEKLSFGDELVWWRTAVQGRERKRERGGTKEGPIRRSTRPPCPTWLLGTTFVVILGDYFIIIYNIN